MPRDRDCAALDLMSRLPSSGEHTCHEFLPIGAVCALQCVSHAWRTRIGVAVRESFRWDVRHRDGVDAPALEWLVGICNARVNVCMLHLVRTFLCIRDFCCTVVRWVGGIGRFVEGSFRLAFCLEGHVAC